MSFVEKKLYSITGFNNSSIFLEVNNILDNQYIDFGNIPQPGRWARFGVKFNM